MSFNQLQSVFGFGLLCISHVRCGDHVKTFETIFVSWTFGMLHKSQPQEFHVQQFETPKLS